LWIPCGRIVVADFSQSFLLRNFLVKIGNHDLFVLSDDTINVEPNLLNSFHFEPEVNMATSRRNKMKF